MDLPSIKLQQAVDQLATLPGVGKRSALRFALYLMKTDEAKFADFVAAVAAIKTEVHSCRRCHCVSDTDLCPICSSPKRQQSLVCVVENIQDVLAIENTQQYRGVYHVLGGVISPIDGIGIRDINIDSLIARIQKGDPAPVEEVILALPTTMEGDTTAFYINRQIAPMGVRVTAIARGVSVGDSLEFADELTLARSIMHRVPFETIG